MPVPTTLLWDIKPHTEAKHRIYRAYLDAWFPILLRSPHWRSVTYAEGYAGPGKYTRGEPGSPIVALRAALGCASPPTQARPARFLLVEENRRRAANLRAVLCAEVGVDQLAEATDRGLHIEVSLGRCDDQLLPLLDRHQVWSQPLLVILDTWGSAVDFAILQRIAASRAAPEVIVTMEPRQFVQFAEDPTHYGDRVFGPVIWRDVSAQPSSGKADYIRRRYRDVLTAAGFKHVLDFQLADTRGNLLYLVYGTNHPRGVTKMKDAIWRVDPFHGIGYRDPRDPNQQLLAIEATPQTGPLRRLILEHLATRPNEQATLDQLREFVLLDTIFKETQTRGAVRELISLSAVHRQPERGHLNGGTLIHLAEQQALAI